MTAEVIDLGAYRPRAEVEEYVTVPGDFFAELMVGTAAVAWAMARGGPGPVPSASPLAVGALRRFLELALASPEAAKMSAAERERMAAALAALPA